MKQKQATYSIISKALHIVTILCIVSLALFSSCTFRKAVQHQIGVSSPKNPSKVTVTSINSCHFSSTQSTQQNTKRTLGDLQSIPQNYFSSLSFTQAYTALVCVLKPDLVTQTKIPLYILYRKFKTQL